MKLLHSLYCHGNSLSKVYWVALFQVLPPIISHIKINDPIPLKFYTTLPLPSLPYRNGMLYSDTFKKKKCHSPDIYGRNCTYSTCLFQMVQTLASNGANSIWEHSLLDPAQVQSGRRKPNPQDKVQ